MLRLRKMLSKVSLPPYGLTLCIFILLHHTMVHATTISVRAPVNPVQEGGIISIYCEVKNLEQWHEVTMFRNLTTHTEKLSVNDDVLPVVGDQVFLARRQLEGSSFVYFLSVIHISKIDSGEYFCKIGDVAGVKANLPVASVVIQTTYFPPATDPICMSPGPVTVREGDTLTLNCSSEQSNPPVLIRWYRTGIDKHLPAKEDTKSDRVYAVANILIAPSDTGSIFICRITSEAYIDKQQTCHVGPVRVLSKTGIPITKPDNTHSEHIEVSTTRTLSNMNDFSDAKFEKPNCDSACISDPSSLLYWILATSAAVVFAFVFLIICITLFMKTRRMNAENNKPVNTYVRATDGIYTELECRRSQNKVYLPIEHNIKFDTQQQ
ncbi:uncharacterized protein [Amphiura filiformis]|uniref:uncharacterized protein n=1 Tax=Amphiura filiformis TaxID=82378 RepID=UPI003B216929